MNCPFCGAEEIRELGYEDGGGDYGESLTLMWKCNICGEVWEEQDQAFVTTTGDDELIATEDMLNGEEDAIFGKEPKWILNPDDVNDIPF